MENVYDVGFHMGVLSGPTESFNVLASSTPNSIEKSTSFKKGNVVSLVDVMHGIEK
jgi:hypothetical protein